MGQAIVITSGKGGVGKTTVSANISVALAMTGNSVVVIDADIGLRNLDVVLGLENRIVYDLVHVIEGHCRLRQALVKDKNLEGLYLLPAAQTRDKTAVTPEQMCDLVNDLKATYDYVIIDCPAGIEQGFRNSIAGSDRAIVVTNPEMSSIRDADRIIGLLEANEIYETHLIINRYRQRMVDEGGMIDKEAIEDILSIPLIGLLPDSEDIITSTNRGIPIAFDYRSRMGKEFHKIVARIQGEEVPFTNFEEEIGFFTKMKRWMGMGRAEA